MKWAPVNMMFLYRDYGTREVVIVWANAVTGKHEKRFTFEQKKEALEFVTNEFNQSAM